MTNFWDYESQTTYRRRQAQAWQEKAQADSQDWLRHSSEVLQGTPDEGAYPLSRDSIFNGHDRLSSSDYDSIVPKQPKSESHGGGLLGGLKDVVDAGLGGIKDAAETVALGPINKPWDLLRPVQRALEAEQKYIARPISKTALGLLPGDYEDLPEIVKAGGDVLFDPLTYIGPGEISAIVKTGKLGWEAKAAAPILETMFRGPGSKRAAAHVLENATYGITSLAGGLAAEQLGLPPLVGGMAAPLALGKARERLMPPKTVEENWIINPENVRVYHSTFADFPGMPDPSKAGSHFGNISVPGSIYTSLDPNIAQSEGGISEWTAEHALQSYKLTHPGQDLTHLGETMGPGRTMPLTLKKGANLFDPAQDQWPKGWEDLNKDYNSGKIRPSYMANMNDLRGDKVMPIFDQIVGYLGGHSELDPHNVEAAKNLEYLNLHGYDENLHTDANLHGRGGVEGRNGLVEDIKNAGYQGIATPYEIIVFDPDILEPAYNKLSMKERARIEGEFALGYTYAKAGGLPESMTKSRNQSLLNSIITSHDEPRYHGTTKVFEELDPRFAGARFSKTVFPDSIYLARDPETASIYSKILSPEEDPFLDRADWNQYKPGSQVRPYFLREGSKVFDPLQDRLPETTEGRRLQSKLDALTHEERSYPQAIYDMPYLDRLTSGERRSLKNILEKQGYQGIDTTHETVLWDQAAIKPMYSVSGVPDILANKKGPPSGPVSSIVPWNKNQPPPGTAEEVGQLAVNRMADDAFIGDFNSRVARGESFTEAEAERAYKLLLEREKFGTDTMSLGGPGAKKRSTMDQLLASVQSVPDDFTSAKSRDEIMYYAAQNRTFTQKSREQIAATLTGEHLDKLKAMVGKGMRLRDTEATLLINENMRMRQLGNPFGAATGGSLRYARQGANDAGVLTTRNINRNGQTSSIVTDQRILDQIPAINALHPDFKLMVDNYLHVEDLMAYWKYFDLTQPQLDVLNLLHSPVARHQELERAYGILSPEDTENGFNIHRQLVKTTAPDINGVLVEGPNGPVVAARPGTKQAFARTQIYPSKSAGIMAGNKYLPFEEGQAARVAQGYATMADEWLNKALDYIGKRPVDLLPEHLTTGLKELTAQSGQAKWLDDKLGQAIDIKASPKQWKDPQWQAMTPEIQALATRAADAAAITTQKERLAAWSEVRKDVQAMRDDYRGRIDPLNKEKMDYYNKIRSGEDLSFRGEYTTGYQGRYFKPEEGQQLLDLLRDDAPRGIERTINTINQSIRPIMATLDLSFMGVQGLLAAFMHPLMYMKTLKTIFTNGYGDYEHSLQTSGRLDSMIKDGVHWAAKNDFSEFIFPSVIQRMPIIGPAADLANTWFSQFGNVMRSEMYNAHVGTSGMLKYGSEAAEQAARKQFVRNLNLITGFTPTDPSSMERTFLFAPRFFRSQLGLVADALSKRQISDEGALRAIGTLGVAGTGLTFAFNEMLGQPTDTDPTSPNFMRIRWGGQDMSIFGTWDTLMRAVSKTVDQGPEAGLAYMARSKASPAMSKILDLIHGETLNGQKLQGGSIENLLTSGLKMASTVGLPISVQTLINEPPDITNPASLAMSGVQFLGTKSTPLSPYENMAIRREALSKQDYNKTWDELEPFQQNNLKNKYNLDLPSTSEIGKQMDYRQAISERFTQEQEKLAQQLPIGKDWIDAYHNLKHEEVGAYAQWAEQNQQAAANLKRRKPKNANEQARQDLYNLYDQSDKEDWTPDILDQKLNDFENSLTPEQKGYIERNTGMNDTPRVKEYKAAQKILKPYWDLQDQVWDRFKTRLPQGDTAPDLDTYTTNLIAQLQDSGMPDELIVRRIQSSPVLREVQRATTALRERYRLAHRDVDRELVKWYGYAPAR